MTSSIKSFDINSNYYSYLATKQETSSIQPIKEIISNSFSFVSNYLHFLAPIDQDIARFYYVDKLSQIQIANIFSICQAAVSRRLKFILERLKFLIKMPTFNPIQIREEFTRLFPKELFEHAFYFYFEFAQNRVKYFIDTSQSGAANKLFRIIDYLEEIASSNPDPSDEVASDKQYLALVYLEYFRFIHTNSNILSCFYKKNDSERVNSFYRGPSVLGNSDLRNKRYANPIIIQSDDDFDFSDD